MSAVEKKVAIKKAATTEKKKRIKGRSKGSGFERYVVKLIVEALQTFGILPEHCWRTPLSGGHMAASKVDPGDLQYHPELAKIFPYSVECKFYRKINWLELFNPTSFQKPNPKRKKKSSGSRIIDWWRQCRAAADASQGRMPLLVMKQNQSDVYCALLQKDYLALSKHNKTNKIHMMLMMATRINGDPVRVITFPDFLRMLVADLKMKKTKVKC